MSPTVDDSRLKIVEHFNTRGYPVALMTAFSPAGSYVSNVQRNCVLANSITQAGFGRIWFVGHWRIKGLELREEAGILVIGDRDGDQKLKEFLTATFRAPDFDINGFILKTSVSHIEMIVANGCGFSSAAIDAPVDLDALARFYTRFRAYPDSYRFTFSATIAPASLMLRMMNKEHYYDNPRKIPTHLKDQ